MVSTGFPFTAGDDVASPAYLAAAGHYHGKVIVLYTC